GDVAVFYKNLSDLSNILIKNNPGEKGQEGQAGYAGRGCLCMYRTWSHRTCRSEQRCTQRRVCDVNNQNCRNVNDCRPVRVCRDEFYSCIDGKNGTDGRRGNPGQRGQYGQIKIIKDLEQIPNQMPSANLTIAQLEASDYILSKQIWQKKTDAHSL